MSKFLVVKGLVHPSHTIEDLGITIAFNEEKTLPYDRVSWSRDMSHAIQNKQVRKVKILSGAPPRTIRTETTKTPVRIPQPPSKKEIPKKVLPEKHFDEEALRRENDRLREMNESLMETSEAMMESQKQMMEVLLTKISELVDRPVQVIQGSPHGVPQGSPQETKANATGDVPMFIPSQIRSDDVKTSKALDVKTSKGKSNAADAAALLRKMRNHDPQSSQD